MPRIVITHAVQDVDRWLRGRGERHAAVPGARNAADLVALDGSPQAGLTFEVDDVEGLTGMLASLPPQVAAQAKAHGVVMPMAVYVERGPARDHAATMRRAYELISAGDIDGFGRLVAPGFVEHDAEPGMAPTKHGVLELFRGYRSAFPDLRMDAHEVIVSGDTTVARVTASGTHDGEFMGMPPSGRRIEVGLIDIMRFDDDGLISDHWGVMDALSMMQQLGVVPEGAPAP
ncbi:hypothetical protein GCM10023168_17980 [Fodinibacter luteus]|uniref:Ester cyclase n=1 Tax=Fodinibacter luteus TaxID=552064 RepID=A0ABP8KEB1_9MICO